MAGAFDTSTRVSLYAEPFFCVVLFQSQKAGCLSQINDNPLSKQDTSMRENRNLLPLAFTNQIIKPID